MNYSFRKKNRTVKYIILHYTGMKDLKTAYLRLMDPSSEVSSHYLISKSGKIYNLLCPKLKAWHAGKSKWKNEENLNESSIGIEIENKGHEFGYTNFTNSQYQSLNKLINSLIVNFRIENQNILYHSDIAPNRKKDPGEKFYFEKMDMSRYKQINKTPRQITIKKMLISYGFSKDYINMYFEDCIIAVKRALNYKKMNKIIDKKFKNDFYNLLFK